MNTLMKSGRFDHRTSVSMLLAAIISCGAGCGSSDSGKATGASGSKTVAGGDAAGASGAPGSGGAATGAGGSAAGGAAGASGAAGSGGAATGTGGSRTGAGGGAAGASGVAGSGGAATGGGAGGSNGAAGAGTSGGTTFAVTTDRYDNARSGVNLQETKLTTTNVNAKQFGLVFSRTVDGQMYAQPLFVGGLTMADKKVHDVVFVATEHNTVYAFDADDPAAAAPLWSLNVGPSGSNACDNLSPEIGITSTPVIDPVAGTIYFISKGQEAGA